MLQLAHRQESAVTCADCGCMWGRRDCGRRGTGYRSTGFLRLWWSNPGRADDRECLQPEGVTSSRSETFDLQPNSRCFFGKTHDLRIAGGPLNPDQTRSRQCNACKRCARQSKRAAGHLCPQGRPSITAAPLILFRCRSCVCLSGRSRGKFRGLTVKITAVSGGNVLCQAAACRVNIPGRTVLG